MSDNAEILLAGLTEVADLYLKSKSLDLAQNQFLMQREDKIADRQARIDEREDDRQHQIAMFDMQKDFQEASREDTQIFQANQAKLALDAQRESRNLTVLMAEWNSLKALERESKQNFKKQFGISPQYKTSNYDDITKDMSRGTSDLISSVQSNIEQANANLESIALQEQSLMEEWTAYENVAADIADMNEIVQRHELASWIEKETAEGGLFEGREDLPGARAAFKKEYSSPGARTKDINIITRQKKAESKALATTVYESIITSLTDEESLGSDVDKWKNAFPKTHNIALQAFSNKNMEDFIYTYHNAPPEFRQELANIGGGIAEQVGHLIAHSDTIRELEAEAAGWSMKDNPEKTIFDHKAALGKLEALDVTNASKEDLFRWHKQNVPLHATDDQHRMIFGEIEQILKARGDDGDFGAEYINWINTGKITQADQADKTLYKGQKDRFGQTGIDFGDKFLFGAEYKWDPKWKMIYVDQEYKGDTFRKYYFQRPGFNTRQWVDADDLRVVDKVSRK